MHFNRGKQQKDRIIALYKKISRLPKGSILSPSKLQKEFEKEFDVRSRMTIYRDIDFLEQSGLISTRQEGKGIEILDSVKIPFHFTERELLAIRSLIEMVEDQKDYPYMKELASIKANLIDPLNNPAIESMLSKIDMHLGSHYPIDINIFESLQNAMDKQRVIEMDYYSPDRNKLETRQFSAYSIFFRKNGWYAVGYCHKRKTIRTFKISRIKRIKFTEEDYEIPEDFSVDKYLENIWELIKTGDRKVNIKVKFTGLAANIVKDMKRHPSQKIEELEDGSIIYSVTLEDWEEFSFWISEYGAGVEVIEPADLKEHMINQAKNILKLYGEKV